MNYIDGRWISGSGPKFYSINPATGEKVWEGAAAAQQDVEATVKAAKGAFSDWSSLPLTKRIEYLEMFGKKLNESENALAEAICLEVGKPRWEAKNEAASMINKIAISIDAYHKRCPETEIKVGGGRSITRHRPHGVVAVFGPFNFPGHLPNGHIIPALLAGNTVVFKPSEFTPLVGIRTAEIWEKCGLPKGVINVIQGGPEVGQALLKHPEVSGFFFTGSWKTGYLFSQELAPYPNKILALEMGGNNPLVIYQTKNLHAAAALTIQSAFLTSGQRCSCARRLIITNDCAEDFLNELLEQVKGITVGPYTQTPEPFMGPVINDKAALVLLKAQEMLIAKGAVPLIPLVHLKEGTGLLSPGVLDVTNASQRPDEELFGPLLQVVRVNSWEEALKEANNTRFGLTAGLISDSEDAYSEFYNAVRAGVVNWNMPLTGASSQAPFGGVGCSGNHRPSAFYAADYCSYPVASMESKTIEPSTG